MQNPSGDNIQTLRKGNSPTVWALGGGKGGVGKTLLGANLAVCLTRMSYSVVVVDLDLGSANLHTCYGSTAPTLSLFDFLSGKAKNISDLIVPTPVPRLSIISGMNDALDMANLPSEQADHLLKELKGIQADFILFDLGAGTHTNTLDFFLSADRHILVLNPEPTSIENTYRFVKSAYYRKLKSLEQTHNIQDVVKDAMDSKNQFGIKTPADLLHHLMKISPELANLLHRELAQLQLDIIMNQCRSRHDIELGHSVKSVCRKYFGLEANYAGHIDFDNAAWQAVRHKKPVVLDFPQARISAQLMSLAKDLVQFKHVRAA